MDNWNDYLAIGSLRQHGFRNNIPITEIVYIHSKLLIIDDKICIIGSANINDRSLAGNRDSELCVVIENVEANEVQRVQSECSECKEDV